MRRKMEQFDLALFDRLQDFGASAQWLANVDALFFQRREKAVLSFRRRQIHFRCKGASSWRDGCVDGLREQDEL